MQPQNTGFSETKSKLKLRLALASEYLQIVTFDYCIHGQLQQYLRKFAEVNRKSLHVSGDNREVTVLSIRPRAYNNNVWLSIAYRRFDRFVEILSDTVCKYCCRALAVLSGSHSNTTCDTSSPVAVPHLGQGISVFTFLHNNFITKLIGSRWLAVSRANLHIYEGIKPECTSLNQ